MSEQRTSSILSGPFAGQPSRRLQPRNALHWPVVIQIYGGNERRGMTMDLSAEGLSLSTDRPIAPGSRCTLLLRPTPDDGWFKLEVKAVYSSYTAPGDFRIGMVFLPQDAEGRDRLRAIAAARV
ncbi:PilZ domain-containing protein [Pseudorhodoferax sp.]|uniref:PilZ domain-containing protein n=1 Tax=Pseudorhodoferax sp. TaxID=1993553 RepID=UPI002DD6494C|nr:PilZ domain-containing protein [Pseudorhodoferax sp.]